MRRRFDKTSRFFQIALWLFVAASFADFANLDDIIAGSAVLHSDEEATEQLPEDINLSARSGYGPSSSRYSAVEEVAAQQHRRIFIVDQDSPTLAADQHTKVESTLFAPEEETVGYRQPFLGEALYLKLHILLI